MARSLRKMKKAEILSLEEATKKYIKDGQQIAFGGFTALNRNPVALTWALIRQGVKDVHVIDRHGSVCTWMLNAADAMRIYETDWMGWAEAFGKLDFILDRRYKAGKLILEDYSHGAMAMRFLAGAMGIPFIPYYAPVGSDLYNPELDALGRAGLRDGSNPKIAKKKFVETEDSFFDEGRIILLPAARPDVALIHVQQCGEKGTIRWKGVGTIDKEICFAADKVIVSTEEIVPESYLRQDPNANEVPYFVVDAIVECPYGAYPSGVPYCYDYDAPMMLAMQDASRTEEDTKKWVDEWIYGPASWEDFMEKVGGKRLMELKANSFTGYSTKIRRGKAPAPQVVEPLSVAKYGY